MGYTHYWRHQELPKKSWQAFRVVVRKILAEATKASIRLAYEYDRPAKAPEVGVERVRFNGVNADGHETFVLERVGDGFAFCKTAAKDYDEVVCAVLIAAKHAFGAAIMVKSDGEWPEWAEGRKLYELATGLEMPISILGEAPPEAKEEEEETDAEQVVRELAAWWAKGDAPVDPSAYIGRDDVSIGFRVQEIVKALDAAKKGG